jgi:hypothetical protein
VCPLRGPSGADRAHRDPGRDRAHPHAPRAADDAACQYGSSVEDAIEKLGYDLYYVKHLSTALDLSIVLEPVKVILFGKGAK